MPEQLNGAVERVTYYNEENGYSVLKIMPEKRYPRAQARDGTVTVVGALPQVNEGETVEFIGEWVVDPRYGRQFRAERAIPVAPTTAKGIINFLSSGIVKGVGPRTAEKIVDHLGAETIAILDNEPERIHDVPGLKPQLADSLIEVWAKNRVMRNNLIYLQGLGISAKIAKRIWDEYHENTQRIIENNPYQLAQDVFLIGFRKADEIARRMGLERDDPHRLRAGLHYALNELAGDGHTYAPREQLLETAADLLGVDDVSQLTVALKGQLSAGKLVQDELTPAESSEPVSLGALLAGEAGTVPAIYLPRFHRAETESARLLRNINNSSSRLIEWNLKQDEIRAENERIHAENEIKRAEHRKMQMEDDRRRHELIQRRQLQKRKNIDYVEGLRPELRSPRKLKTGEGKEKRKPKQKVDEDTYGLREVVRDNVVLTFDLIIESLQKRNKLKLARLQKESTKHSLNSKISVLTGGPGTGKTTTLKMITMVLGELSDRDLTFRLAAPTGRAAKRLSEATGMPASTIHRLLGYAPDGGFEHDESDPLPVDMVVIDEASMLDLWLFHNLLKALQPTAHLLLVGDVDQLPSVGAGNVLRDVIDSGIAHVTRLDQIFRQDDSSHIVSNAHRINQGKQPISDNQSNDFYFFNVADPEAVADNIVEIVKTKLPQRGGFDPVADIQVIAPMYRGAAGVNNLNERLQAELNGDPRQAQLKIGARVFRVGDKVMQTRNNYDKDVFNGDIGFIHSIDHSDNSLEIDMDGSYVHYEFNETADLMHAYCISTHRSQGSEYPAVVMPILTQHYVMLQRNLLYTAITRAKRMVVLVGTRNALRIAVNNNNVAQRHSGLLHRLRVQPSSSQTLGPLPPSTQRI